MSPLSGKPSRSGLNRPSAHLMSEAPAPLPLASSWIDPRKRVMSGIPGARSTTLTVPVLRMVRLTGSTITWTPASGMISRPLSRMGPVLTLGPPAAARRGSTRPGAPPGRPRSSPSGRRPPRPGRAGAPRPPPRPGRDARSARRSRRPTSRIFLPDSVTTAPPPSSVADGLGEDALRRADQARRAPRRGAGHDAVAPPDAAGPALRAVPDEADAPVGVAERETVAGASRAHRHGGSAGRVAQEQLPARVLVEDQQAAARPR